MFKTKIKFFRVLIILCSLIASTILLYLAYANFTVVSDKSNAVLTFKVDTTNTKIDLGYFNDDYNQNNIIAIGVIGSQTCASCVTELLEYSDQINKTNEQFFDSDKVAIYFAVIGTDSVSAYRFEKSYDLIGRTIFVDFDSKLGQTLYQWEKDKYLSQWVFVNNSNSTITSRISVLSRLTPLLPKKSLVEMAVFSKNLIERYNLCSNQNL
ncbi:MAG: hypothetical protein FH748_13305 [Balneolaceae bacterium]|nr:hypothetical protein [Balneolaceae bacterium]